MCEGIVGYQGHIESNAGERAHERAALSARDVSSRHDFIKNICKRGVSTAESLCQYDILTSSVYSISPVCRDIRVPAHRDFIKNIAR